MKLLGYNVCVCVCVCAYEGWWKVLSPTKKEIAYCIALLRDMLDDGDPSSNPWQVYVLLFEKDKSISSLFNLK